MCLLVCWGALEAIVMQLFLALINATDLEPNSIITSELESSQELSFTMSPVLLASRTNRIGRKHIFLQQSLMMPLLAAVNGTHAWQQCSKIACRHEAFPQTAHHSLMVSALWGKAASKATKRGQAKACNINADAVT